ncbi:MAG: HAD-IA family hydrolase [Chloroflexota bacterium]
MIKTVFFDWFHTLARYDPPREELHSRLLHDFGIEVSPSDLMPGLLAADGYFFTEGARAVPGKERSPQGQPERYRRYLEIMLETAGVHAAPELLPRILQQWPKLFGGSHFVLFDDVLPTIKGLKERRLTLGLLTNATREAIAIYADLGLAPYLDFVVTSEEAGADKPSPKIFLKALEKAGVSPPEAMHVGDQYDIDVAGARGAGINPLLLDRFNLYAGGTDCPRIQTLPEITAYL